MTVRKTYEVVTIFQIAPQSYFPSIMIVCWPFAPVKSIYRPWCKVIAVGGHSICAIV